MYVDITLILLPVFTAFCLGVANYWNGTAARSFGSYRTACVGQFFNFLTVALLAFVIPGNLTLNGFVWGLVAGMCGVSGMLTFYQAMALGHLGVVAKIQSGITALIPFFAAVALGYTVSIYVAFGVCLLVMAVLMLAGRRNGGNAGRSGLERSVELALIAGVSYGVAGIALAQTSEHDGLFPLVGYRMVTWPIMTVVIIRLHQFQQLRKAPKRALGGGVTAAVGDGAYLVALQQGALAFAPAISSLYAVVLAILARIFAKERLHRIQIVGIAIGAVGLLFLKAG